jgi:hypothetical protein
MYLFLDATFIISLGATETKTRQANFLTTLKFIVIFLSNARTIQGQ